MQHQLLILASGPWFADWNHRVLERLFGVLPHTVSRGDWFEFWIENPLIGTWFFAAFFYRFWSIDDAQRAYRRSLLFRTLAALGIACLITLAVRPWVHWPSPLREPQFQTLFPRYMWGGGSANCFPSHSTLVYFTVAAGFWPLRRSVSICLAAFALAAISFPRMYLGGHYPIDVLFSCGLGIAMLAATSCWRTPDSLNHWLTREGTGTAIRDWLVFLWLFELGEGFRGVEFMAGLIRELQRRS